ncbi:erythromycin esterase family protein [Bacillus sp. BRMEA1]|uniref:erythromycin esterase family protein n=1 Tax=Neobacillus endophyticus TaxID=2738405 RepID=UPI0015676AA4|nr:erythromycin esterase family protein [Neobacillus endophyticus]NRD76610.1 erythromycin esterase family protein [Neobacillus endophyticus]
MRHAYKIVLMVSISFSILLFTSFSNISGSGETYAWLKNNGYKVNSLTSNNYNDLKFLKNVLKGKQYVFLGESSHGVAEYSMAKVRLIKYLHEDLGFDVIVFESNIGDAVVASTELTSNPYTNAFKIMGKFLFVWNNNQTKPLFDYIINEKSTNPLTFTGFDMQASGIFTDFMNKWIQSYNQTEAQEFSKLETSWTDMYSNEKRLSKEDVQYYEKGYNNAISFVNAHSKDLVINYPKNQNLKDLVIKTLQNRIEFIRKVSQSNYTETDVFDIRDLMMEENVICLSDVIYPNKKIIFWGHNTHIRDNNSEIYAKDYGRNYFQKWKQKSMFEYLPAEYKKKSYNIGFYMHDGIIQAGQKTINVNNGKSYGGNSLEYILNQVPFDYLFINLEGQKKGKNNKWMFEPITALSQGEWQEQLIVRNHYDGLFFIKHVSPPY